MIDSFLENINYLHNLVIIKTNLPQKTKKEIVMTIQSMKRSLSEYVESNSLTDLDGVNDDKSEFWDWLNQGSNAETRTIEKYGFEPIELSYVAGLDQDGQPIYSEDWDSIYDKDKDKYLIDGKEVEGYFLEKQIAKREGIILKIIQHWLGLTSQETVKGKKIIDDNLFTHPQEKLYN